jgi:hypothetical protein
VDACFIIPAYAARLPSAEPRLSVRTPSTRERAVGSPIPLERRHGLPPPEWIGVSSGVPQWKTAQAPNPMFASDGRCWVTIIHVLLALCVDGQRLDYLLPKTRLAHCHGYHPTWLDIAHYLRTQTRKRPHTTVTKRHLRVVMSLSRGPQNCKSTARDRVGCGRAKQAAKLQTVPHAARNARSYKHRGRQTANSTARGPECEVL